MKTLMKTKPMKIVLPVALALAVGTAHAEPVKPGGTYTEAKIQGAQATTGVAPVNGQVAARPAAKPAGLTQEVKVWVKTKITEIKSLWTRFGGAPAAAPVAAKPATAPAAAPALGTAKAGQPAPSQNSGTTNAMVKPVGTGATTAPSMGAAAMAPISAPANRGVAQQPSAPAPAPKVFGVGAKPGDLPNFKRTDSGVAKFEIDTKAEVIPRLDVDREELSGASRYALDTKMQSVMDKRIVHPFPSPELLPFVQFKAMTSVTTGAPIDASKVKNIVFTPKGRVSREAFDAISYQMFPETPVKLEKYIALTAEEQRFLSGLLLYQQGDKCASAVGLFHKLSKNPTYQSEADYYLAMCSRKLGLNTDYYERARRVLASGDTHYSPKILADIGTDIPYEFTESIGDSLVKLSTNPKIMDKLDAKAKSDLAYNLSDYGAFTDRYKTALYWAKQVTPSHDKFLRAQFMLALAEYQVGSKANALRIQEELINEPSTDKEKAEFQAVVALNLARMYFQESKFKKAHEAFLKVNKNHPLWLTSLTEMGWSQLQSGDFEGAIGNMYSIQSPYFGNVYKPESFVIRTIGYLNLCQYADAYKTLSILEHEYRSYLDKMEGYIGRSAGKPVYYTTVKNFLTTGKDSKEVDGLPVQIIREMARHRDFTNLQKALNRQVDERPNYAKLDAEVVKSLKRSQYLVNNTRRRLDGLRNKLTASKKTSDYEKTRLELTAQMDKEFDQLNDYFFQVDLYNEAKAALPLYQAEVVGGVDNRLASMRTKMEKILAARLLRMKMDLGRALDNNELLRYEVFAGSGENIRYQVAGGEKGNRVPASVIPKSKSLQWEFDGEYWEDEIGHYRSSLKNNCADKNREQASLDGGVQ